jgi:hypothetical protein
MDTSIEYIPLHWRLIDGYWYLVRDRGHYIQRVYGPFDEQEALHAGEIWGVSFKEAA